MKTCIDRKALANLAETWRSLRSDFDCKRMQSTRNEPNEKPVSILMSHRKPCGAGGALAFKTLPRFCFLPGFSYF